MPNKMTKWSDTAEIPLSPVVKWKLAYYAVIIGKEADECREEDLSFGFDNLVSAEASGYFARWDIVAGLRKWCRPLKGLCRSATESRHIQPSYQGGKGFQRRGAIDAPRRPSPARQCGGLLARKVRRLRRGSSKSLSAAASLVH